MSCVIGAVGEWCHRLGFKTENFQLKLRAGENIFEEFREFYFGVVRLTSTAPINIFHLQIPESNISHTPPLQLPEAT